jgi:hypothetical protein
MRKTFLTLFFFVTVIMSAQDNKNNQNLKLWKLPVGNANLEWKDTVELAVRIDGKPYFVDGTSLDSHGDAMPMMAFVLLSEGVRYWRKKQSISGFTIQITTRRKENKAKLVSLILQNSTKQIAHQKESYV